MLIAMAMSAAPSNTFGATIPAPDQQVGQAEDVRDVIDRIDPTKTPFYSNARKGTCTAVNPEWQTQNLSDPDLTSQPEGYTAVLQAVTPTIMLANFTEISARSFGTSGTADAIKTHGRSKESAYQRVLKGLEIRRDVETKLMANRAKAGATATRTAAGFPAYVASESGAGNGMPAYFKGGNVSYEGAGTLATGDGTDAYTNATGTRAVSVTLVDDVMELCKNNGAEPNTMMSGARISRQFSKAAIADGGTNVVDNRVNHSASSPITVVGAVDSYLSDFGTLQRVVNIWMKPTDPTAAVGATNGDFMFIIDWSYLRIRNLPGRAFISEMLPKNGDYHPEHCLFEGTLEVTPQAQGIICDLYSA